MIKSIKQQYIDLREGRMTNINAVALKRFGTFGLVITGELDSNSFQKDSSTLVINLHSDTGAGKQDAKTIQFPEPQKMIEYLDYLETKISIFSSVSFITPNDIKNTGSGGNGIYLAMKNDLALNDAVENLGLNLPDSERNGGPIHSSSDFDDRDGAGPSNQIESPTMASTGNAAKRQRIDAGPSEPMDQGVTQSSTSASMSSGADGGFDSTSGPDDTLFMGGYQARPGSMTFTKVHEITMEAIPYTTINDATFRSGANLTVTPLARIDWDMPYFYLSEEDFNKIPAGK